MRYVVAINETKRERILHVVLVVLLVDVVEEVDDDDARSRQFHHS